MAQRNTFVNALVGAAVTVLFTFLPFSPVLGGAVAGYLQRGDYREGAKVGAISGLLAAIPMALFVTFVAALVTIVPAVGGRAGVGLFFGVLFLMAASFFLVYTVGLSALGGAIGIALADEIRDESPDAERSPESEYAERAPESTFAEPSPESESDEPPSVEDERDDES